jgi:hypothetical protein
MVVQLGFTIFASVYKPSTSSANERCQFYSLGVNTNVAFGVTAFVIMGMVWAVWGMQQFVKLMLRRSGSDQPQEKHEPVPE